MRRWSLIALAALAGCGGASDGYVSEPGDPHTPRTEEKRELAGRFRSFARALEDGDRTPDGFRVGRHVRAAGAVKGDLLAAFDTFYKGDEIQISSEVTHPPRQRLIVFFHRAGDDWRVKRAMIGVYAD